MKRFVEAIKLLHFLEGFGGDLHTPSAASTAATSFSGLPHLVAHDLSLDGTARNKMHDGENHHGNAEECRNNQQKAADEIARHCFRECSDRRLTWPLIPSSRIPANICLPLHRREA